jgi:hypothetical protein
MCIWQEQRKLETTRETERNKANDENLKEKTEYLLKGNK